MNHFFLLFGIVAEAVQIPQVIAPVFFDLDKCLEHNLFAKEDLDILLDVIAEIAPDYLPAYEQYIEGDEEYLYNMFVMSREDFKDYGDFIFPVLAEFAKRRPHKEDRLYVSERLTGAFLFYLKNQEKRILHLPLLLTRSRSLKAAFRQTKANFKEHPENGFHFKTKPLWLTLLPRWLEQRLRNRTRII